MGGAIVRAMAPPARKRSRPAKKQRTATAPSSEERARTESEPSSYQRIYRVVAKIPRGRVATYGQVAELADLPRAARQVGYALAALHDQKLPWHRVLNAAGEVSARSEPQFEGLQRAMLEREGVKFDARGRVSLAHYRWLADTDPEAAANGVSTREQPARRRARPRR
jgi:methylated-DNA-protein-cysteine methyltransferase-like protein